MQILKSLQEACRVLWIDPPLIGLGHEDVDNTVWGKVHTALHGRAPEGNRSYVTQNRKEDCLKRGRETSQETGENQQGWGGGTEFE